MPSSTERSARTHSRWNLFSPLHKSFIYAPTSLGIKEMEVAKNARVCVWRGREEKFPLFYLASPLKNSAKKSNDKNVSALPWASRVELQGIRQTRLLPFAGVWGADDRLWRRRHRSPASDIIRSPLLPASRSSQWMGRPFFLQSVCVCVRESSGTEIGWIFFPSLFLIKEEVHISRLSGNVYTCVCYRISWVRFSVLV